MDSKQTSFRFSPDILQFVADNWGKAFVIILAMGFAWYNDDRFSLVALAVLMLMIPILIYQFWFFTTVSWVVNEQHIIYSRGIFNRYVDYVELYRIIDYREEQDLLQQLFGIKTLTLFSGDPSHPTLRLYGLKEEERIVDFIRKNVEKQKKDKKIYEITNR